uniref:Uncharacterized protein n=1 Tax=Solanum tuberosum TaxID=4113 RepID=M1DCX1_SOLTU
MTKSKTTDRITPAQEKSKEIAIKEDAFTSKGKASKLPTTTGKGKGKNHTFTRKTITLDLRSPSWARGFCRAVYRTCVLSPEGKGQVGDEMEQSVCCRAVLRSSTITSNDSKCEEAEGYNRKAMKLIKRRITECIGDPD